MNNLRTFFKAIETDQFMQDLSLCGGSTLLGIVVDSSPGMQALKDYLLAHPESVEHCVFRVMTLLHDIPEHWWRNELYISSYLHILNQVDRKEALFCSYAIMGTPRAKNMLCSMTIDRIIKQELSL